MLHCILLGATLLIGSAVAGGEGATVDVAAAVQRPQATEVWSFRVEYRSRRSPQFAWGPWHHYTTITGNYGEAYNRANKIADMIDGVSKNYQSRVVPRRIR